MDAIRPARLLADLHSCVSSPLNMLLTVAIVALALWALPGLVHWLLIDAVWSGKPARDCAGRDGACWIFLRAHAGQLLYGSYPPGQRWRLAVAAVIGTTMVIAAGSSMRRLGLMSTGLILITGSIVIGVLMTGSVAGLPYVATSLWGGILLTTVIAAWTIVTALPLGLLLALARQSELPIISAIAGAFIDSVRGLPLVGLLFLVIVMFPLFVPRGFETDKLVRTLLAFTRPIPLIVVPQVISVSIPRLINICIAIAKETTIVILLGLFDFVGALQAGSADPDWLMSQSVRTTAYVFAALVF